MSVLGNICQMTVLRSCSSRHQELQLLDQVPEPTRTVWNKRFASKEDHARFSVRLELHLYNFFIKLGWAIEIEPELRGTPIGRILLSTPGPLR